MIVMRVVLVDGRDFFADDANQRLALDGGGDSLGKLFAIDGQRVTGGNRGLARDLHQQRTGAAHLLFQQPGRGVLGVGLQRVGAHQLGKVRGLVRGRRAHRPHLEQLDRDAAAGALPGCFRAGQSGADDADGFVHAGDAARICRYYTGWYGGDHGTSVVR